ncbi:MULTISPECIES: AhpA/YtjB family protein [Pseudidiomarina]|uniref:Membrane protein affecting hemolysin expression n=2 Tax=Pseudidiomarina TaxID=2800384 RepID=A0A368ULY3_9GAMM|nr:MULTISPECIES: AhpA/YtjB family protein [Pseudidiomarina]PWW09840.1 putative membrane protein affecting hemolysin expression [Pseudidiomarina maritima]RBP87768.1 putative membrane protein affecting hemolysin expression [Pseudidiomarina tainanensis]RCW29762.1 putative membrane protein affecting hemolysin expression [Pseudidiomarina tainanensis]
MSKLPSHVISSFQLVYRRLRRLGLAVLLVVLIEQFWGTMHTTSLQEFQSHSHQLMQTTARQAAFSAQQWLANDQPEHLDALVNQLQQQPFIAAASVQNRYGEELTQSHFQADSDALQQAFILVEEISDGDTIYGYLTLVIDEALLLEQPLNTHSYLSFYGQFLLAFAILAGVLLATTFNRWRRTVTTPANP